MTQFDELMTQSNATFMKQFYDPVEQFIIIYTAFIQFVNFGTCLDTF